MLLTGNWVRSYEDERGDGAAVFLNREADTFPATRFREQYTLLPNGRMQGMVLHPSDAHYLASGEWVVQGNVLNLDFGGATVTYRLLDVDEAQLLMVLIEQVD